MLHWGQPLSHGGSLHQWSESLVTHTRIQKLEECPPGHHYSYVGRIWQVKFCQNCLMFTLKAYCICDKVRPFQLISLFRVMLALKTYQATKKKNPTLIIFFVCLFSSKNSLKAYLHIYKKQIYNLDTALCKVTKLSIFFNQPLSSQNLG